ncbi:DUF2891 domain-containing protein [soil metagenome]
MDVITRAFQPLFEQTIPITLTNLHREYPNGLLHQLTSDADVQAPRVLHPVFFGCYDWHSAVHCHWQVVRALHCFPNAAFVPAANAALARSFTAEHIAGELTYLRTRSGFEIPYGMAWLLQLMVELREMATPQSLQWQTLLQPLEQLAIERLCAYLQRLPYPIRSGMHNQTAFAMGLAFDWARATGDMTTITLLHERARHFFAADRNAPLAYEPAAVDFLSPTLAEADLMRRVLPQAEFADWLGGFLGNNAEEKLINWLMPVQVVDYSEGQLAHFTGLNLSRTWMLEGIYNALPENDRRRPILFDLAQRHRAVGLVDAFHPDYMVAHWAPSFALYLLSQRGLGPSLS